MIDEHSRIVYKKEIKMQHNSHQSCDNRDCHNYVDRHSDSHSHCDHHDHHHNDHSHEHNHNHDHNHGTLSDLLQRHKESNSDYKHSQIELAQQQENQQQHNLQVVHRLLNNEVRTLLEQHQYTLCLNGYSTGIQSISTTLDSTALNDTDDEYVISISLHVNEVANDIANDDSSAQQPSKDSKSISHIRFFGVPQSSEIQCQYMNAQLQSKNFTLGLEAESHSNLSEQGDALVQDFISFVLLFKRAEISGLR